MGLLLTQGPSIGSVLIRYHKQVEFPHQCTSARLDRGVYCQEQLWVKDIVTIKSVFLIVKYFLAVLWHLSTMPFPEGAYAHHSLMPHSSKN